MSDKFIEDILNHAEGEDLAHYGTLGMRWGVRKDRKTPAVATTALIADPMFSNALISGNVSKKYGDAIAKVALGIQKKLYKNPKFIARALNKVNKRYSDTDLQDLEKKRQYFKDVSFEFTKMVAGMTPLGLTALVDISHTDDGDPVSTLLVGNNAWVKYIKEKASEVSHSDDETEPAFIELTIGLVSSESGFILGLSEVDQTTEENSKNSVLHGILETSDFIEEDIEDYLAHWGILGMRWGVRKDNRGRKTGKPISGTEAATREGTSKSRPRVQTSIDVANTPKEDGAELTDEERGRAAVEMALNSGLDVIDIKEITPDGVTLRVSRPMTDNELRDEINGARLDREYQTLFDENQVKNSELRTTIERIKMEREYAALTAPKKSAANQFVRDIVLTSVKTAGTALLTTALKRAGGKAMGDIFKARDVKVEGDIKSAIKESVVDAKDRKMAERILKESTARSDLRIRRAADVKTATRSAIDLLPDRAFRPRVDTPVPLTSFRGQQIDQIIKELKS